MFSTPARKRAGLILLYACGAAFLMLVVAVLASLQQQAAETRHLAQSVRDTQLEGTPLGKQLLTSSDRILDCTDPGDPATGRPPGQCFSDSQARTAKAVADINRVVIIAAACSAGLPAGLTVDQRQNEIQSCVIDRLAQRAAKP